MTSNELLIRDKQLAAYWTGVVRDERFEQIVLLANNEAMGFETLDMIRGARKILEALRTLADGPSPEFRMPESGLIHETQPKKQ